MRNVGELSDRETRRNVLCATRGKRVKGKKQEKSGEAKADSRSNAQKCAKCGFVAEVG